MTQLGATLYSIESYNAPFVLLVAISKTRLVWDHERIGINDMIEPLRTIKLLV